MKDVGSRANRGRAVASDFSTLREGSLHAALKARYAASIAGARVEAAVDGFIVDVASEDELVEVQTASFASASRKLERLVVAHRVVLVHPIAVERWLVRVDADGAVLRRTRSPKRGLAMDLFDELVHIPTLVADPNFRIELSLIHEEEIRGPIPERARYRYPRDWWRLDRRLLEVVETRRIDTPDDLALLLPYGLPEVFTTADIVAASGRSKRLAMRAVYCLERSGAIERQARQGRFAAYRLVADHQIAARGTRGPSGCSGHGTAVGLSAGPLADGLDEHEIAEGLAPASQAALDERTHDSRPRSVLVESCA